MLDISLNKFQDAEKILQGKVLNAPLLSLYDLHTPHGNNILIKAECLQPSGSFKIRGASYCLTLLTPEQKKNGVIAYSTGNHAQAVAFAAKLLNIKATIVMSPDAPHFKIEATKKYGATVIMSDPSSQARKVMAEELANTHGFYLVPPYDDIDVITGQGTIGLEIMSAVTPAAVFVPIGGGGLISGIAIAIKKMNPSVKIIGVEPELENDAYLSFKEKKLVSLPQSSKSIADAIKVQTLGTITFPFILNYVDDIVTVSEKQIIAATLMLYDKAHLVVEPSGSLGLAAALEYNKMLLKNLPVVCVASGGNIPLTNLYLLANTT